MRRVCTLKLLEPAVLTAIAVQAHDFNCSRQGVALRTLGAALADVEVAVLVACVEARF